MSAEVLSVAELTGEPPRAQSKGSRRLAQGENLLVSVALAIMLLLPLAEAILRRTLHIFIPASVTIVRHMVLVVGMLGGAIAARERRLLALSNIADTKLKPPWRGISRVFTNGFGVVVALLLAVAAFQFVRSERVTGRLLG